MRIQRFNTAYIALLIAAAMMTIISFFGSKTIDIHLHDTMFVISPAFVFRLFLLFIFLLYLANKWLVRIYGKANLFLWIVLIETWLTWGTMAYLHFMESEQFERYIDTSAFPNRTIYNLWIEKIITVVTIIFLFLQVAFWLYFIAILVLNC